MIRPRSFSYSPEWFRTVICAVSFALVGWFLFPNPTEADLIVSGTDTLASPATWTNQNAERTDTIGWTVTFPANVTVDWVPATGTYNPASGGSASIEGTMTITANFPDTNPISIGFQQVAAGTKNNPNPTPRAPGLGLRFQLDSVNNNQDPTTGWGSFAMKLVDPNVQPTFDNTSLDNQGLHPSFPHFHGKGTPTPFNFVSGSDDGNKGMGFVNFGNDGTVGPTGVFDTGLIGVHDFEVSGLARQFTLVLQPNTTFTQPPILTPEPSTLSLLLVLAGVVALIGTFRKGIE